MRIKIKDYTKNLLFLCISSFSFFIPIFIIFHNIQFQSQIIIKDDAHHQHQQCDPPFRPSTTAGLLRGFLNLTLRYKCRQFLEAACLGGTLPLKLKHDLNEAVDLQPADPRRILDDGVLDGPVQVAVGLEDHVPGAGNRQTRPILFLPLLHLVEDMQEEIV
jgi:hypothetical protein